MEVGRETSVSRTADAYVDVLLIPLVYGGEERGRVARAQALFFSGNFGLANRAADSQMSAVSALVGT